MPAMMYYYIFFVVVLVLTWKPIVAAESEECVVPTVKLANGVDMPLLSLGTAHLVTTNGKLMSFAPEKTYRSVQVALESGMRGIDTALIYRSHKAIGHVLANWFTTGALKREDVFLTTKVFHGPVGIATAKSHMPNMDTLSPQQVTRIVTEQFEQALTEVGVGYFDLLLMHWPAGIGSKDPGNRARRFAAWKVLEGFYERGWAHAIGVSNFSQRHLEQLVEDGAKIQPMVNQIEASVYLQYQDIMDYCKKKGIVFQAYSPLGGGRNNIMEDKVLSEVAKKHEKTVGHIALRFLIQKDYAITVLSTSAERIKSNLEIFSFALDDDDMAKLSALARVDGSWGLPPPDDMT